ncbi:MAG: DUF3800 domain-containing protein [Bacteroidetes bacterium]|nr:DUF3800 domain-containing protein [Bacteroidota bacterium]
MYFCYIDEAGTPDMSDASTHFVLTGFTIPVWKWKTCEIDINRIKKKYSLENTEIHTSWILRNYHEQELIKDFEKLPNFQRKSEVEKYRNIYLHKLQSNPKYNKAYKQTKKNYIHTRDYIHLTLKERKEYITELVTCIGKWGFARLFAECIDKLYWNPSVAKQSIDEQAFDQIVSRFEHFLQILDASQKTELSSPKRDILNYGLIIHDNNETIAKKHTQLMKEFHKKGTLWTKIKNIIETPLFVNSQLTSMVQIADLCCYLLRRYVEKGEEELFKEIYKRADRKDDAVVGIRHYSVPTCKCIICKHHSKIEE